MVSANQAERLPWLGPGVGRPPRWPRSPGWGHGGWLGTLARRHSVHRPPSPGAADAATCARDAGRLALRVPQAHVGPPRPGPVQGCGGAGGAADPRPGPARSGLQDQVPPAPSPARPPGQQGTSRGSRRPHLPSSPSLGQGPGAPLPNHRLRGRGALFPLESPGPSLTPRAVWAPWERGRRGAPVSGDGAVIPTPWRSPWGSEGSSQRRQATGTWPSWGPWVCKAPRAVPGRGACPGGGAAPWAGAGTRPTLPSGRGQWIQAKA